MNESVIRKIKWGDIYYCDLGVGKGSVQSKLRPVLVVQNNVGNENGPTIVVAAISSVLKKMHLPTHVILDTSCGLKEESVVMLEQIRTVDIAVELKEYIGTITEKETVAAVKQGLAIELGLLGRTVKNQCSLVLTLCPKCRNDFLRNPENILQRQDRMQSTKECCDICQMRSGFEYVIHKRHQLERRSPKLKLMLAPQKILCKRFSTKARISHVCCA